MDLRLIHPSSHLICGQSGCGKSTLAATLVRYKNIMFNPVPKHVIWIYSERVSIPEDLLRDNLIDECYEGYESYTFLRERVMAHRDDGGSICFFDDALSSPSLQKDIDRIFYELGHHSRTSFMMASQELFHQRSKYRTASKQLANLWLFSSKRSATDIYNLARQMSPADYTYIVRYVVALLTTYFIFSFLKVHFLLQSISRRYRECTTSIHVLWISSKISYSD